MADTANVRIPRRLQHVPAIDDDSPSRPAPHNRSVGPLSKRALRTEAGFALRWRHIHLIKLGAVASNQSALSTIVSQPSIDEI